jgi:disulfide bond formation protein DsbB
MRRSETLRYALNELFFLAMMVVIAGILIAAMAMQYGRGELPCPLCLIERAAMLGICFGIMQNFRHGFSDRNLGFSLLFALVLLVVAVRQTLLDIYPRPGHEYVGSAILGLHMPVWSVVIATACIAAIALKLVILGSEQGKPGPRRGSRTAKAAAALSLLVIAIAAVNFASVVVQCGVGQCHTESYALLR